MLANIYVVAFINSILLVTVVRTWGVNTTIGTTPKPHWSGILCRKKRALIFPSGSHFKFTLSLGKRLLAKYPKGLNFNLEAAAYYPLPTAQNRQGGHSMKSANESTSSNSGTATSPISSSTSEWFNYQDKKQHLPPGIWSPPLKDWTTTHDIHSITRPSLKDLHFPDIGAPDFYKHRDFFQRSDAKNWNRLHFPAHRQRRALFQYYFEGFSGL